MSKQKIAIALTVLALLTTTLFVAPSVFAQSTSGSTKPNFFQGLITFLEQKFGLSQSQVQSAVSQYKSQVKATITPRPTLSQDQILAQEKTRLDKLVSSGKITGDQETAILGELSTLWTNNNLGSQSLTAAQRKTAMQTMQSELKTWAQSENINLAYVMPFGGMEGPRGNGQGGFRGHWGKPTVTPTPTP